MAVTFRTLFRTLTPSWLHVGEGELILYSLAVMKDAAMERLRLGFLARFPSYSPPDGLDLLGSDRLIPRGRTETDAHYAGRLVQWRFPFGHRVRGSAWGLLTQIREYFGGAAAYTIDVRGNRFDMAADGLQSYTAGAAWDWDGAGASPAWARFWVVLDGTTAGLEAYPYSLGDPELWGGSLGNPEHTIGIDGMTPDDAIALRNLVQGRHPWKPAGTRAEWLIVSLDGTDPEPEASWRYWSIQSGSTKVAARDQAFRYISLTPAAHAYAGDPNVDGGALASLLLVDGLPYVGSAADAASLTLPNGDVYVGSARDSAALPLPDDGSIAS